MPTKPFQFARHVAAVFGAQASLLVCTILTGVLVARMLGAGGKGLLALAMLIPGTLALLLNAGAGMGAVYLAGARRYGLSTLAGTLSFFGIVTAAVGWVLCVAAWRVGLIDVILPQVPLALGGLALLALPALLLTGFYTSLLQASGRMAMVAGVTTGQGVATLVLTAAALAVFDGYVAAAVAAASAASVVAAFLAGAALRRIGVDLRPRWHAGAMRGVLGFGLRGHPSNIFQFFTYRLDVFIAGAVLGPAAVGVYTVAVALAELLWHLPNAIGFVIFPRAASSDGREMNAFTPAVARVTLALTLAAAAIMAALGRPLIRFVFSPAFEDAYIPLLALLPGVVALGGAKVLSNDLAGRGYPQYNTITASAAFACTVALDLLLIPRLGILGAAAASSAAYIATAGLTWFWHRRVRIDTAADAYAAPASAAQHDGVGPQSRMRIAYLLTWNPQPGSGIFKKIEDQIGQWREFGHDVAVWLLSPAGLTVPERVAAVPVHAATYRSRRGGLLSAGGRFSALERLRKSIVEWRPDVVYLRYELYYPALAALAGELPVVVEVNSDDVNEYRIAQSRMRYWYNRLTRGWLLHRVRGMVFVTGELARHPSFASYQKPSMVIGNGIDLSRVRLLPPATGTTPRLVFIGSTAQAWYGVDKVVRLARRLPAWRFDLIGVSSAELPALPPNVTAHGVLDARRYETLMAEAHAAVGSLAYHRVGMHEASTLKVREYLASGIPVILGCPDTDFPASEAFLLVLPNTEHNVERSLEAIKAFVARIKGTRVPRERIVHLDVRIKEASRIAFLREVAGFGETRPVRRVTPPGVVGMTGRSRDIGVKAAGEGRRA